MGVLSKIRTLLTSSKCLYLEQKVAFSSISADPLNNLFDFSAPRGTGPLLLLDPTTGNPASQVSCLFDWAQSAYGNLFSSPSAVIPTQFSAPYSYRYYGKTNSFLGVSSTDTHVYYEGPNGVVNDEGAITGWLATAGCQ